MSRIAVVGAGISGMAAAHFLGRRHDVWLLEREARLGGHTHTVHVDTPRGTLGIDTGFIVFNERNYPRLIALFDELGVESQPSDMSFSVSDRRTGFEYSSRGANGFFADRANLFRASHFRLLAEIRRFHRRARVLLDGPESAGEGESVGARRVARREGFSEAFAARFLYPMASSIWSTSRGEVGAFPARMMARFFHNHGLLQMFGNPKWRVVRGGSSSYIAPAHRAACATGSCSTRASPRSTGARTASSCAWPAGLRWPSTRSCWPATATRCCRCWPTRPTPSGRSSRSSRRAATKPGCTPTVRCCRAGGRPAPPGTTTSSGGGRGVTLTYHMNRLQAIDAAEDYCVTLEPEGLVDESKVIRKLTYRHPLYTAETLRTQRRWAEVSGHRRTHYCGAYWFDGFHEDGVRSAQRVAEALGAA